MEFKLNDYHRNVSDEELINDLRRVAKQLGKDSITIEEYKHIGKYSRDTVSRRFGGWIAALQKSGLSVTGSQLNHQGIDKNDMIADLKYVADKLCKKTFTTTEYSKYGKYSKDHYSQKFGSWNKALEMAGLEPFDHPLGGGTKNKVSRYACLEEIERLWIEFGRQPTTTDIKMGRSRYSLHVFERRFGSWRKALEFFVKYMNGDAQTENLVNSDDVKNGFNQVQTSLNKSITHKTKRDINLKMRFLVMKRDSFKCCLCGRSPATTPGLELHIDHIKPWSKGGETTIDNLQTLCSDCNLGKSDL